MSPSWSNLHPMSDCGELTPGLFVDPSLDSIDVREGFVSLYVVPMNCKTEDKFL